MVGSSVEVGLVVSCCVVVSGVDEGVVSWVLLGSVVDIAVVEVVTPVPICLLSLGSTPSAIVSARIWAKPKKRESMAAVFRGSMRKRL